MYDAIEKMRKVLSANKEASINIECLLEDQDMNYTLKREEFQELIKGSLLKIEQTLINLNEILKLKNIKVYNQYFL